MQRTLRTLALALAALSTTTSVARAETTLKWGEHLPQCCSMYAAAAQWAVDETAKRSNGDLKIDINYGGVLATVGEIPSAVENGVIDMGNLVTPYFPDQFVINNAIPFFWPQPKSQAELGELMLKWHDEVPAFGEELAKYKLKLVAVRPLPPYGLICSKPIRTMEDFKGKRIRSYGVALPAMLEALGAVPVGMPDVEAYEAMSNNILDCSAADIALVDAFKLNEVAKFFVDVPMGASWGHIIVMNTDKYAALSDSQKAVIDSLKTDHQSELLRLFRAKEAELVAKWSADKSVEIIKFPAEEFLKATLENPKVQAVRNSWKDRAIAAGMPAADAERVVKDISN
ncbi:MAG: TRAP transporter substrate-binding protein DctP [Gemmobacter sp.]|nr:TRAP transporter substrate-binding protein DctP [Gemmobacter sp.]